VAVVYRRIGGNRHVLLVRVQHLPVLCLTLQIVWGCLFWEAQQHSWASA
jgi:hypothetical protein